MIDTPVNVTRGLVALLIALFAIAWFASLDARKLIHPDEGRYAEIAREMAVTGDWVTPRLNGLKYFEKPPLQYWMTAAAYRAFGVHEWTARLWPALTSFASILVVGYAGWRLGGAALGLYAGLALAGTAAYSINAHLLSLDAGLGACLATVLAGFLIAQRPEAGPQAQRNWMLVAWTGMALATLSKGLIGIVLPGGALVLYTLLQRDFALWRRLHLGKGLLLFVALCAPWFILVARANDEFLHFFFVHEHFQRFTTTEHRRTGPWWYFVPLLVAGALPWVLLLLYGARRAWSRGQPARNGFSWQRFAIAWAAFVFLFFSASGSKLPSYILPMFPALALLAGWLLLQYDTRMLSRLTLPLTLAAAIVMVALIPVDESLLRRFLDPERQPLHIVASYLPWVATALGIAVVGGGVACWAFRQPDGRGRTLGVVAIAFSALLAVQVGEAGYDVFRETRSSYDLFARAQARHGPLRRDVPFYQVRMYDQTAPFYLDRTTTLVAFRDELALGIDAEPGKAYASIGRWLPVWAALDQGYALMPDEEVEPLQAGGMPMVELARDSRRVLVSRR
jgi:4-amino-4-deoxy-L-arabinose transferase-like glycosyltransferase